MGQGISKGFSEEIVGERSVGVRTSLMKLGAGIRRVVGRTPGREAVESTAHLS